MRHIQAASVCFLSLLMEFVATSAPASVFHVKANGYTVLRSFSITLGKGWLTRHTKANSTLKDPEGPWFYNTRHGRIARTLPGFYFGNHVHIQVSSTDNAGDAIRLAIQTNKDCARRYPILAPFKIGGWRCCPYMFETQHGFRGAVVIYKRSEAIYVAFTASKIEDFATVRSAVKTIRVSDHRVRRKWLRS